ncbi:hypothetical protein KUTeg_000267 [Tegillarca granosa]|uniref:Uncharacterized protein n=1 Tax=Tegillarca granosa TaxID=220873 RepID=A0ABQ9FYF7_TEGGR|nr:hypothetical protein KUTeg_000267 [Tegillarca granosa]
MNIITEVKRRRWCWIGWCWIGHTLRMKKTRYPRQALIWTPMGKRKQGRPNHKKDFGRRKDTDGEDLA